MKVLKAPTFEQVVEMGRLLESLQDTGFETNADEVNVVWWTTESGAVQPVIWPMVTHAHTQECFRA